MRITATARTANERRIRAAMDRLLRGEIPPGGNCDVKTLAHESDVDRTASTATAPTPTCAPNSKTASRAPGCRGHPQPEDRAGRPTQSRQRQA